MISGCMLPHSCSRKMIIPIPRATFRGVLQIRRAKRDEPEGLGQTGDRSGVWTAPAKPRERMGPGFGSPWAHRHFVVPRSAPSIPIGLPGNRVGRNHSRLSSDHNIVRNSVYSIRGCQHRLGIVHPTVVDHTYRRSASLRGRSAPACAAYVACQWLPENLSEETHVKYAEKDPRGYMHTLAK
jgi:hypothetical protein